MRTIVSKFGGSSTANAAQFRRILAISRASPARRCIVLSAPGTDAANDQKITGLLADCWRYRRDGDRCQELMTAVANRYSDIALKLGLPDVRERVLYEIARALNTSEACTLSRGEYLCALLFSRFSGIPMLDAKDAVAFDSFGDVDAERTRQRLVDAAVTKHERIVLPGFYGADPEGRIRTFPKNGSDITGAIAAASLCAGLYENWTDVPGLMTADPAIVPEARLIPHISYRQMRALSRAGAQVLHPACLDPVAMAGIPTRLRSTLQPESFGTLIDERCDRIVPCVAGQKDAKLPDGRPAARISLFGAYSASVRTAARAFDPIAVIDHSEHTDVYVPASAYARALRSLHGALVPRR